MRKLLLSCVLLAGCDPAGGGASAVTPNAAWQDWADWHAEKREVDLAVDEVLDRPGGGDFARAVEIIRESNRPQAVKDAQIGWLIIDGFDRPAVKRPPETLQQGLEMVERAATQAGETRDYTPQHLRMLFERGAGRAPNHIPIDVTVAQCWRAIESKKAADPARCIALRRERLPRVGG